MSERRERGSDPRRPTAAALLALAWMMIGLHSASLASQQAAPGSLTLRRAVELALAHAPEIAVALAAQREGTAGARLAADALAPEAALTSNPGYVRGLPLAVAGGIPSLAGVEVKKILYDPVRRGEIAEGQVGEATARAAYERARRDSARAAAALYARCWGDRQALASAAAREAAATRGRSLAEARADEGRATPLESRQARLREAQAKLKRLDLEGERDADESALRRLIGWPEGEPLSLADDPATALPPPPAAGGLAAARSADPELAVLGREIEIRRAAELHGLSPRVEAGARYLRLFPSQYEPYYPPRSFRADDWSVGLALTLPLPLGRRAADGRARQQAALDRLESERRARESQLALDVRQAERSLGRAEAAADLAREGQSVAEESLRVTRALAGEGRIGDDELAAREADLADAGEQQARAAAGLGQARAVLLALRGELPGAEASAAAPAIKE